MLKDHIQKKNKSKALYENLEINCSFLCHDHQ